MQPRFGRMEEPPRDDAEEGEENYASVLPKRNPLVERIEEGLENLVGGGLEKAINFTDRTIAPVIGQMFEKKTEERETPPRTFGYPEGYEGLKSPERQLGMLKELFPYLHFDEVERLIEKKSLAFNAPAHEGIEHAEGWALVPSWKSVAPTYEEALTHVLDLLVERRILDSNWREEWGDEFRVRQRSHTAKSLEMLQYDQTGDALIIPVQFGLRFRGLAATEARKHFEKAESHEFGLDTFTLAVLLLTHPERFEGNGGLWVYALGDELDSDADGSHEHLPSFGKSLHRVRLLYGFEKVGGARSGGASGFLWTPYKS